MDKAKLGKLKAEIKILIVCSVKLAIVFGKIVAPSIDY